MTTLLHGRSSSRSSTVGKGARRVAVIGGGIAGLATAALLASRGHSVDLLEQNDELGGRVGSFERDGFRFDTGASWYLMPEVFEHFFSLLGTTAEERAGPDRPRPELPRVLRGAPQAGRRPSRPHAQPGAVRVVGAGRRLSVRRLPAAQPRRRTTSPCAVFSTATSTPRQHSCIPTSYAGLPSSPAADPIARQPRCGTVLRQPAAPAAGLPRGLPRLLPEPGTEHVPPDEPSRPRRPGALPAGRVHAAHRGHRVAGRAPRSAAAHRHHRNGDSHRCRLQGRPAPGNGRGAPCRAGGRRTLPADVVVGAADLHHLETALLPPSLQTHPQQAWRRRSPGPSAVLAMLGVEGRLPQLAHHSLFFTSDWDRNFGDIFGRDPASRTPRRSTSASRRRPTRPWRPTGARTYSSWCRFRPTSSIGHGGDDGQGSETVERATDAAIDQVAAWAGVRRPARPHPGAAHRRSRGLRPAVQRLARRRARPRAHAAPERVLPPRQRLGEGRRTVLRRSQHRPRRGLPMCLISAELVLKRLTGDRSTLPVAG